GVEQYAREGYPGEQERHHQGGLTGYAGREIFATARADHALSENQALAWNPSITGTKSEDTVLVRDGFAEILTRTGAWPESAVAEARQRGATWDDIAEALSLGRQSVLYGFRALSTLPRRGATKAQEKSDANPPFDFHVEDRDGEHVIVGLRGNLAGHAWTNML